MGKTLPIAVLLLFGAIARAGEDPTP